MSQTTKGKYFYKKRYIHADLPSFEENRDRLPIPVIENNEEWTDMYWYAWEEAFKKLRQPFEGSPFVSNYIDEGFNDNIFQWDTNCMVLFGKYAHHIFPFIESHDNFYISQHENGYICREISEKDGSDFIFADISNTVNGPLFGWVELEYYKIAGDKNRLRQILPVLKKSAEFFEAERKWKSTRHELYWQTMLGSGMDNLPRSGVGWVDMSTQVAMMHQSIAEIYALTGENERGIKHILKADKISELINHWLWNEELGLYCNVNFQGDQIDDKNIAAFWPMVAGIPNKDQAGKLLKNAMDPDMFYRYLPFSTLAATEKRYHHFGNYWQGGVWAPTNYMVLKGLEKYGYYLEAHQAAEKSIVSIYKDFKKTRTLWEYYSPDEGYVSYREDKMLRGPTDEPGKYWAKPDFVGWSGLFAINILIENVIGINANGVENLISWNIFRNDMHGIKNLNFGNQTLSLICHHSEKNGKRYIEVACEKDFYLKIKKGEIEKKYYIDKGNSKIEL